FRYHQHPSCRLKLDSVSSFHHQTEQLSRSKRPTMDCLCLLDVFAMLMPSPRPQPPSVVALASSLPVSAGRTERFDSLSRTSSEPERLSPASAVPCHRKQPQLSERSVGSTWQHNWQTVRPVGNLLKRDSRRISNWPQC